MTEKTPVPKTAMEALDEGLNYGVNGGEGASPEAPVEAVEDDRDMPLGFDQVDSDLTPEQIRRIRINMYFWHTVGFFLSPFAFALRLGRWSMRTLVCHHNGDEFGGF